MPNPFFIQNPATKFVIDIAENPAQSGDLDAFNKKSSREGYVNQLWKFVPFTMLSYINYYFIQNPQTGLVIAIDGPGVNSEGILKGELKAPAKLFVKPIMLDPGSTGAFGDGDPKNWNQLWGFLPDGLGHYWIVNPSSQFVIDIAEGNRPLAHFDLVRCSTPTRRKLAPLETRTSSGRSSLKMAILQYPCRPFPSAWHRWYRRKLGIQTSS
jgi:hypothetical protein